MYKKLPMVNKIPTRITPSPLFKQDGFTLAELLLVVSIIAIMSAASIPGFRGYIRNQNLKQSVEQVKSDLRSVQTKAMAGSGADSNPDLSYWGITFFAGLPTYNSFTATSSFSTAQQGVSESLIGDIVLRNNSTIFFSVPSGDAFTLGGVPCDSTGSNCIVLIGPVDATGNNCYSIRINTAGAIFKYENVSCSVI